MLDENDIQTKFLRLYSGLSSRASLVSVLVIVIISLFVVELPAPLLDILLTVNLMLALTLLLRGLFLEKAAGLYAFPTILVLSTLFRLALNVSSTKLVLLHGHEGLNAAGEVIRAFGEFVVSGSFVVGAIIFGIIAIVNFVVIAKGSGRVAEVSARFTLDALPGKQLAIDAELRSGSITSEEAAVLRRELTEESRFFGAMDGAMKWVQGDAVAGLVITFINAIGGISIGVSRGLPFVDSVNQFGVLTIGDGLVSILPSLLISVAAGIIVTHVSGEKNEGSGEQVFTQLLSDPRPVVVASTAMLLLGLLDLVGIIDFTSLPLLVVGGASLFWVYRSPLEQFGLAPASKGTTGVTNYGRLSSSPAALLGAPPDDPAEHILGSHSALDRLCISVDPSILAPYLGVPLHSDVQRIPDSQNERLSMFETLAAESREDLYKDYGLIVPKISLDLDRQLAKGCYKVFVRGEVVRSGTLAVDELFINANVGLLVVMGVAASRSVQHPVDSSSAAWAKAQQSGINALRHLGIDVLNPAKFLILECVGAAFEVVDEIFGLNEVKGLLDEIELKHSHLIDEVVRSGLLNYLELTEILRRLVRERVSIRDLKLILEGVAEYAAQNASEDDRQEWLHGLHAFLRRVLSRTIINSSLGPGDKLRTFVLSSGIEDEFRSAVSMWDHSRTKPPLDPLFEVSLRDNAVKLFNPVLERGAVPIVVLCPDDIRPAVQDFFGRQMPSSNWVRTVAYEEIGSQHKPEAIGVLSVAN